MRRKISFAGPWITQKEIDYVNDAVKNGWYETFDKDVRALEKTVAEYLGVKYTLATHCCTLALHLACEAIGLTPEDEVIVTDMSWVATAYAIAYTGAKCVFVDVDPDSWCIDPKAIEQAITPKTKAIMLVHMYGHPAQMDQIMEIAQRYHLRVIEDAAPALGSRFKGQLVGTFGDIGCISFHGAKIAASGEGGIFCTNDEELFKRASLLASMGRTDRLAVYWSDEIGYQYTMGNLAASMARAQVERIDELIEKKRTIFGWYEERLGSISGIKLIKEKKDCFSNYVYPSILLQESIKADRDTVIRQLKEVNVHCRPAHGRMSLFPAFEQRYPNPVVKNAGERGISLPSAANMTEDDADFVCENLIDFIHCK